MQHLQLLLWGKTIPIPFFEGDGFEFRSSQFSPFRVQEDSHDDAPFTQKQLTAITKNLDSLINYSQAFSSDVYFTTVMEAFFKSMTKEH